MATYQTEIQSTDVSSLKDTFEEALYIGAMC